MRPVKPVNLLQNAFNFGYSSLGSSYIAEVKYVVNFHVFE